MGKPYINNAVIGNGSMLGCVSESGELIRLYWPEIDFPQHLEKMLTGFFDTQNSHSTIWFSEGDHEVSQNYVDSTNILVTKAVLKRLSLEVTQTDFCLPDLPVMIRHYSVKNINSAGFNLGISVASHVISHTQDLGNTLFDFSVDSLVHYRHGYCWAIGSSREVKEFQIGNNPFGAVWAGRLNGIDSIGMSPDGALLWDMGHLPPGGECSLTVYISFAKSLNELKALLPKVKKVSFEELYNSVKEYWHNYIKGCFQIKTGNEKADKIYERSLLLFGLMSDKNTGGLLASPEIDEDFTRCGRYAYCWGRDAAFITEALDEAGLFEATEKFYDWAVRVQDPDGFWHQRYHMDGSLAPSWGIQIDETGSVLYGMLKHYQQVKDMNFLKKVWPSVEKAVAFLINFIDEDTGLPLPSFDLWEERMGEHTYSTAAFIAGVNAAVKMGEYLGIASIDLERWKLAAKKMQDAMERQLVDKDRRVFLRSVRTKLNPWGPEPSPVTVTIKVNSKGFYREVSAVDAKMDISLLGPAIPFSILEPEHETVINTASEIERTLYCRNTGGIFRYEDDTYAGGNPWIISSLWMALYYIKARNLQKAREYFYWVLKCATHLDLLPEQVDRHDGKPCWVIPLTWSHAMYVLVLKELMKNGGIL